MSLSLRLKSLAVVAIGLAAIVAATACTGVQPTPTPLPPSPGIGVQPTPTPLPPSPGISGMPNPYVKKTFDGYTVQFQKGEVNGKMDISTAGKEIQVFIREGAGPDVPSYMVANCNPTVVRYTGSKSVSRGADPELDRKADALLVEWYNWIGVQPDCTIK